LSLDFPLFIRFVVAVPLSNFVRSRQGKEVASKDKHKKAFFFERQNFLRKPNK
jgi:hypothetical protein